MSGMIIVEKKEGVFFEAEGKIKITSLQELAYYLYQNLYMLQADFCNEKLLDFLSELGQKHLVTKLSMGIAGKKSYLLLANEILQSIAYYSEKEKREIEEEIQKMLHRTPVENKKIRADFRYEAGELNEAWKEYRELSQEINPYEHETLCAELYHRIAMIQGRLFLYEEALENINRALDLMPQEKYRKNLIALLLLCEKGANALEPKQIEKKKAMFSLKFQITQEEFDVMRRQIEQEECALQEIHLTPAQARQYFCSLKETYRNIETERERECHRTREKNY